MDTSTPVLQPHEARFDWITASAPADKQGLSLLWAGQVWAEQEAKRGQAVEPWRFMQYDGMKSRHIRYGWSGQGALVVVSGEQAEAMAPRLATLASHWSRADICVTVVDPRPERNWVYDYWWTQLHRPPRKSNEAVHAMFAEVGGGSTYYVGKRSSASFLRCYDKHHESKGDYPPGSWRWEVEAKRHVSEQLHNIVKMGAWTPEYAGNYVAMEWERQALPLPWEKSFEVKRHPEVRHKNDAERKKLWLTECVAPTVEFCAQALGTDVVLKALKLPSIRYAPSELP